MTVMGTIGALALYLLFIWLGSAIVAGYLSERKGYGEKAGLASGLLLSVLGVVAWLLIRPLPDSDWRVVGPLPWQREKLDG